MADTSLVDDAGVAARPGEPLGSGFEMRPAREARLSETARQRVIDKMDSVDAARLRAARDGHSAYVG